MCITIIKSGPNYLFSRELVYQKHKSTWNGYIHIQVSMCVNNALKVCSGHFLGGPVAKTPCSQNRGPRFDSWSGS